MSPSKCKRAQQTGQGTIEYTVVLVLLVIAIIARPDVITTLVQAIKDVYEGFTYAISFSWIPA